MSAERLRQIIAQAAAGLRQFDAQATGSTDVGAIYLFPSEVDAAVEWLLVRANPEDRRLVLAVPVDDCPLEGPSDISLPRELVGRLLVARCGHGFWARRELFPRTLRVGCVPNDALSLVHRQVDDLARGRLAPSEPQAQSDCDPEYAHWMKLIERARDQVRDRLNRPGLVYAYRDLADSPPNELVGEPQLAFAADPGDELLADLESAAAQAQAGVRYLPVEVEDLGRLVLLADEHGVGAVWDGPVPAPLLSAEVTPGQVRAAEWLTSPDGRRLRTASLFPWVGGQVAFTVGAGPFRNVTIVQ